MAKIIVPTIGRQVWFWPAKDTTQSLQPEAATVCYVHSDHLVNLQVIDLVGRARGECSVLLCQPGEEAPVDLGRYCEWMPFQISQAKTQAS